MVREAVLGLNEAYFTASPFNVRSVGTQYPGAHKHAQISTALCG